MVLFPSTPLKSPLLLTAHVPHRRLILLSVQLIRPAIMIYIALSPSLNRLAAFSWVYCCAARATWRALWLPRCLEGIHTPWRTIDLSFIVCATFIRLRSRSRDCSNYLNECILTVTPVPRDLSLLLSYRLCPISTSIVPTNCAAGPVKTAPPMPKTAATAGTCPVTTRIAPTTINSAWCSSTNSPSERVALTSQVGALAAIVTPGKLRQYDTMECRINLPSSGRLRTGPLLEASIRMNSRQGQRTATEKVERRSSDRRRRRSRLEPHYLIVLSYSPEDAGTHWML